MREFDYLRAEDIASATAATSVPGSRLLAGGTTLIDLMKCDVEQPDRLIDITSLVGMSAIELEENVIRIGSLCKMSQVAQHEALQNIAPAVIQSLTSAASAQLRNMATIGGNIMQRTRCSYFRDAHGYQNCNKRHPGSGCAARTGMNRNHAVLGNSEHCVAVYPGDLAVALTAFDATLQLQAVDGSERRVTVEEFLLLPGDRPDQEQDLHAGEIITAVEIPVTAALQRSHYLKVRDRSSYEFAAASAAVGLELEEDGVTLREVRIALGGVATRPWRLRALEQALRGKPFNEQQLRDLAPLAMQEASALAHNGYKITLAPRVIVRALLNAGGIA
ncbi:FAD binding domain-containing protein [Pantoea sp. FN0305]|uniref:FAD binding domain-containing protein n=1 Tax=Pantoea sp. FN0305 TaxID=3418559 RepID=UPI003CF0AA7A